MNKLLTRARATAPSIGFLVILAAFSGIVAACGGRVQPPPTPTLSAGAAVPATLTPTPTRVIIAAERTPNAEAKASKAIWVGVIASTSSRQFVSNGKVVNACNTSWSTGLTLVIDSAGQVAGYGTGNLVSMQCSPLGRSGNTTSMNIKVDGTKDAANLNLHLSVKSITPPISGDFGGYGLLFNTMTCPGSPRTSIVPLTSPTAAKGSLKFNGVLTGCGGSKDDTVNSDNVIEVQFSAQCENRPTDLQNPEVDGLCQ